MRILITSWFNLAGEARKFVVAAELLTACLGNFGWADVQVLATYRVKN